MAKVVFVGDDASGNRNLWVTDGTPAGTSELMVKGVGDLGLFPGDLTVLGQKVLFNGTDSDNSAKLWVTDGTGSGTSELAVAGAYSLGLDPGEFFDFNNEALFEDFDSHGDPNLWITNGTGAGTTELTVSGAFSGGLFSGGTTRGVPEISADFTLLGKEVVFEGTDASCGTTLWVTDGTSAGTNELIVAGAYSGGLFAEIDPDFAPAGGKVVFAGEDAAFHYNLWVTDGTSGGTSELSVTGAR